MIAHTTFRIVAVVAAGSMLAAGPAGASQSNDSFDHAARVDRLPFHQIVVPATATLEAGEPSPSCSIAAGSVWYRLELGSPASVAIIGDGDSTGTFIAVWEGDSFADLQERACDDDAWGARPSQVSFIASLGAVYHVQVGPAWGAGEGSALRIVVSQGVVAAASAGRDGAEAGAAWSAEETGVGGDVHADRIGAEVDADRRAGRVSVEGCARAWHATWCTPTP